MNSKQIKSNAKKIWHFLAHEDSWESFLVDAVLIILIGKFIVYPVIGLLLGTSYPIVAVVSASMDHNGDFQTWWDTQKEWYEDQGITEEEFSAFPYSNGFYKGDVFIVKKIPMSELEIGDVAVFASGTQRNPIIHRVVDVSDAYFQTKGDANLGQIYFEKNITESQYLGKATARAPKIGWVKVIFIDIIDALKR